MIFFHILKCPSVQSFHVIVATFIQKTPVVPLHCKSLSSTEVFDDNTEVTPLKGLSSCYSCSAKPSLQLNEMWQRLFLERTDSCAGGGHQLWSCSGLAKWQVTWRVHVQSSTASPGCLYACLLSWKWTDTDKLQFRIITQPLGLRKKKSRIQISH